MSDANSPLVDYSVTADSFDLSAPEFWVQPQAQREGAFHALRQKQGLLFSAEIDLPDSPFPTGPGYWSLVRHEDVWFVSRNP